MFLLLACTEPSDTPAPGDDSAETAGDTDETADTGTEPFDCGVVDPPPALSAKAWSPAGALPAGGIQSITSTAGRYPVFAGGLLTGAWRADDPSMLWDTMNVWRTHTWAEIAVNEADPDEVFHSSGGQLYRSRDGGENWQPLDLGSVGADPEQTVLVYALAVDGSDVYGILTDGAAAISHDHGDTFETVGAVGLLPDAGHEGWRLLLPADEGQSTFLVAAGHLYLSPDRMRTWAPSAVDVTGAFSLVRTAEGVVVGTGDGYALTRDEGETWEVTRMAPVSFAVVSQGDLMLVSGDTLYDGGIPRTLPVHPTFLGQVEGRLLLGHDEGILYSDDRGATWTSAPSGMFDPGMSVVEAHPVCADRVIVASLCSGGVYLSGDHGTTWTHSDDYLHYVMDVKFDPRDPDRVWSVSDDALLRSDDGGESWVLVHEDYHFHGFATDPSDPERLLLGSVGSGMWSDETMRVYLSEDGGATWTDSSGGLPEAQSSAQVLHFVDADTVLLGTYKGGDVTHNSGQGVGLYRSTDRGVTWEITSLPEIDVAGLADGPGGVWAATGGGLYRSGDGGVTWEATGPTTAWYLSVAFHGDTGLAYDLTGQGWVTHDGGRTWAGSGETLAVPGDRWLAQVSISADGSVGYLTVPDHGVWRIAL